MRRITDNFEKEHFDRIITKKLEDTYIWPILDSKEEFLKEAEKAGLKPGEDYTCTDGEIYPSEYGLVLLSEYLILKCKEPYDPSVCEDDYRYPLDMNGSYSCESIIKKILSGNFGNIHNIIWFSGNDFDENPDHNYLQRIKNAGLVQDIDFLILYKDAEGVNIVDIFMTENAWNRFINKYPQSIAQ